VIRSRSSRWTLYILGCADGSLYTGITNALARRLTAHAAGKGGKYTRSRLPVRLVWSRACRSARDARRLEAALKKLPRREKLLVVAGRRRLPRLAAPMGDSPAQRAGSKARSKRPPA